MLASGESMVVQHTGQNLRHSPTATKPHQKHNAPQNKNGGRRRTSKKGGGWEGEGCGRKAAEAAAAAELAERRSRATSDEAAAWQLQCGVENGEKVAFLKGGQFFIFFTVLVVNFIQAILFS